MPRKSLKINDATYDRLIKEAQRINAKSLGACIDASLKNTLKCSKCLLKDNNNQLRAELEKLKETPECTSQHSIELPECKYMALPDPLESFIYCYGIKTPIEVCKQNYFRRKVKEGKGECLPKELERRELKEEEKQDTWKPPTRRTSTRQPQIDMGNSEGVHNGFYYRKD